MTIMTQTEPDDMPPAVPAATLILFRDRPNGPPEILMVERAAKMAFAGGAVVFPGGRIDDEDHALAARFPAIDPDCAAARIGAIRETIEESGIPVGIVGSPPPSWLADARAALHSGQPFTELLDGAGLTLDLDMLVPFARWLPKHREARVFDTRFYVARAPADLPLEKVDETENVRTFWESAAGVIALAAEEKVKVIYPTMRNLERLALFASYDEAEAQSRAIPVRTVSPFMEERDGHRSLCIPEGHGYPVTFERLDVAVTAFNLK
jgi:8-oxo-dGTP pyrophosphatase MutT (NUDIX family)